MLPWIVISLPVGLFEIYIPGEVFISFFNVPEIPEDRLFNEYNATRPYILDGSGSIDPDTSPLPVLVHYWELVSAPDGGSVSFEDQFVISPTVNFTGITGEYTISHYVYDGQSLDVSTEILNVVGYPPKFGPTLVIPLPPTNSSVPMYVNTSHILLPLVSDPDNYPGNGINVTIIPILEGGNYTVTPITYNTWDPEPWFTFTPEQPGTYVFLFNATDGIYTTVIPFDVTVFPEPDVPTLPPITETPSNSCNTTYPGGFCITNAILCQAAGNLTHPYSQKGDPLVECAISGGFCCGPDIPILPPTPSPSVTPSPTPTPTPTTGPPTIPSPSPPPQNGTDGGTDTPPLIETFPNVPFIDMFAFVAVLIAILLFCGLVITIVFNSPSLYNGLYRDFEGNLYTGNEIPSKYF